MYKIHTSVEEITPFPNGLNKIKSTVLLNFVLVFHILSQLQGRKVVQREKLCPISESCPLEGLSFAAV